MSPGRNHEKIAELIGILIEAYCDIKDIRYFPFGSTRLKKEGFEGKEEDPCAEEASAPCAVRADTGYAFVTDKEYPDLAVEVNFTSGSISDLTKYKYLKIKEVWLWQNRKIKFYYLEGDSYQEKVESPTLPGIKSLTLIKYLDRGFVESPLDIKKDWKKQFNNA